MLEEYLKELKEEKPKILKFTAKNQQKWQPFNDENYHLLVDLIKSNDSLEVLNLDHHAILDGFPEIFKVLLNKKNLKELHLSLNVLNNLKLKNKDPNYSDPFSEKEDKSKKDFIESLADFIAQSTTLKVLNLEENAINNEDLGVLASAIRKNNSLVDIDFSENFFNGLYTKEKDKEEENCLLRIKEFFDAVFSHKSIKKVSAVDLLVDFNSLLEIVKSFDRNNPPLEDLEFGNVEWSAKYVDDKKDENAIEIFASALGKNKTLKYLNIPNYKHSFTEEEDIRDFSPIFKALASHPKIEVLMLTDNKLGGEKNTKALAEFLKNTKTLKTLHCPGCNLNNDDFKLIVEALKGNESLKLIEIGMNKIDNLGLIASLIKNTKIEYIGGAHVIKYTEEELKDYVDAIKERKKDESSQFKTIENSDLNLKYDINSELLKNKYSIDKENLRMELRELYFQTSQEESSLVGQNSDDLDNNNNNTENLP